MMQNQLMIDVGGHWLAVVFYIAAAITNAVGIVFERPQAEKRSYRLAVIGLVIHGLALLYRWLVVTGHGPYITRYEVFSSNSWITLCLFLVFLRFFPRIRLASIVIFPATFLFIACGIFFNQATVKLPATFKSIWLVAHILFIKIAVATLLIALAFSVFYVLKKRRRYKWLKRLPELEVIDVYAYRFAGFGFIFWTNAILSGSIWAYQSWGRFWGWDPVETWSFITWLFFGMYLHLRRFFHLRGERATAVYILCFVMSIMTLFYLPLLDISIHSEYFVRSP